MVHVLKVYIPSPSGQSDIRRLTVNGDVLGSYNVLVEKIMALVPRLGGKCFELCWKDNEGDDIVITTDEELAHAVANIDDGIVRINVRFSGVDAIDAPLKPEVAASDFHPGVSDASAELHPGVSCDGCGSAVVGLRYKCLQCCDYDLCTSCNASGKHPFHDMIKLVIPSSFPRQWLFPGWRRMFKSMFGFEPKSEMIDRSEQKDAPSHEHSRARPMEPMGFPPINENFCKFMSQNSELLGGMGQVISGFLKPMGLDVTVNIDKKPSAEKTPESEKPKEEPKTMPANDVKTKPEGANEPKPQTPPEQPKSQTKPEQPQPRAVPKQFDASLESLFQTFFGHPGQCEPASPEDLSKGARPKSKSSSPTRQGASGMSQGLFAEVKKINLEDSSKETVVASAPTLVATSEVVDDIGQVYEKKSSPLNELNQESSGTADGWTVINAPVNLKKAEVLIAAEANREVHYPNLAEVEVTESSKGPAVSEGEAAASGEAAATKSSEENTTVKEVSQSIEKDLTEFAQLDPDVSNALIKMFAMGFTNEGGWLVRLLQAKKGNIYAALDSLYPNQRH